MTEPARKATFSAGASPSLAASAVREFERTATFMPMKPAAAERTRADQEPEGRPPAELVIDAEQR